MYLGGVPRTDHLDNLPRLPKEYKGRTIYVDRIGEEMTLLLEDKGYSVVDLFCLPRSTMEEEREFLDAKRQAIEEGTVIVNSHILRALELGMRAAGLMGKERSLKVTLDDDSQSLTELLGWGEDRHTLEGNSTVVGAQRKKNHGQ